ncbi:hypothetical protein KIN20_003996 [Parelaphostrongylus tenuis]|uniref:Uncharacterized protein n=1 Tax=Parelaphostrongylus tenuis TaxID=148309 RepID=A0AAD5MJ35_PARTN|nr:hypothetical protein KIN20_003996 [Parelaphostrongylus tenuis]
MARLLADFVMISLFAPISTVFGCGVMPAGQAGTRPFTVTGFTTFPIQMVYSSAANIQVCLSGIAPNEAVARGRSAFLPDAVISAILGQLNVTVSYTPMNCQMSVKPEDKDHKHHLANWPRMMWQSVVDRAVRMLASDSFGLHFFSARVTVGGN